jgi:hypothetical protein
MIEADDMLFTSLTFFKKIKACELGPDLAGSRVGHFLMVQVLGLA